MVRFNKGTYGKLVNKLCKMNWGFQVIYNDDDMDDPRIEFVYRNEYAVIRSKRDAKVWLQVLRKERW